MQDTGGRCEGKTVNLNASHQLTNEKKLNEGFIPSRRKLVKDIPIKGETGSINSPT